MLNFTSLARLSTSRSPWLKGLLPTASTLFTLLAISLALASGLWLWAGAVATLTSFVPLFAQTFAGIAGLALLNFWFSRDITTAVLSSRESREGFKYDEYNVTDLRKLVDHVRCELNASFREKYGDAHVDLPMPRICIYTSDKPKIQATFGRTPENASLFFADTFFNSKNTRWNQRHIAALVAHQLTQAYNRRGWSATIVSIASNFLFTLEALQDSSHWYYRALGLLAGPLQFFFFVQKAIDRSYSYEAAGFVADLGRGMDFYDAIDIKVCPSLCKQPPYSYLSRDQAKKKREPYNGFLATWLRPIANWIDDLVLPEDQNDKNGWRIVNLLDGVVRESIYSLQEMNSSDPRTTRLKDHLRAKLKIGALSRELPLTQQAVADTTIRDFIQRLNDLSLISVIDRQRFILLLEERRHFREFSRFQLEELWDKPFSDLSEAQFEKLIKIICEQEFVGLDHVDRNTNRVLFNKISEAQRFNSIGPDGNGLMKSRDSQSKRITRLERELDELKRNIAEIRQENGAAAAHVIHQHGQPVASEEINNGDIVIPDPENGHQPGSNPSFH